MSLASNIKYYRQRENLTQEELAEKVDVARSTVTQWETGWSQPRMGAIQRIASVLNVSVSDLVADSISMNSTSRPAASITPTPSRVAYAPLLGRVHAGDAQEPVLLEEKISAPYEVIQHRPHAYFLEVEGMCMGNVYPEGCYVLVDPDVVPQNGSIAVVSIDGEDYVMRRMFRGANTLVLSPDTYVEGFEDIVVSNPDDHEVKFAGAVVWFQAAKEME